MEFVVAGAILNTIGPKVFDLLKDARVNRYELKADVQYIKDELKSLHASFQKPEFQRISTSQEASQLINRAGQLAQDTEEYLCRFIHRDRLQCGVTGVEFASKIKVLKEGLTELKNDVSSLRPGSTTSSKEPEVPHLDKKYLVGMDVPSQEVVELLKQSPPESATKGKLKVISIVGFGGSGKTRLAKKVFEQTGEQFDLKVWVHMGLERNVNEVLNEILKKVSTRTSTGVQQVDNGSGASTSVKHVDSGANASNGAQHVDSHATASTNVAEGLKSSLCNQSASNGVQLQQVDNGTGASNNVQHVDNGTGTSTSVQHVDNGVDASTGIQHLNNSVGASTDIQHVDGHASTSTDVEKRLKSYLCNKRYLIVIDDVRRKTDWSSLEEVFPDNNVGSRIIVTTTSERVAERCSGCHGHVYKMSTLCGGDSEKLFLDNAVTKRSSGEVDEDLLTLLNICDGLPLALIESAESLKGRTLNQHACEEAIDMLCDLNARENGTLGRMQWVLMNKYSCLTSYSARSCLLYFHMFPSDNPTKRKFLARRWLAEGFVERAQSRYSDLDAASKQLMTLSECNIIRSMQVSNNATVKSCKLPGTMHEFISRQSRSQNFVSFLCQHGPDKPAEPSYVRRLSLSDGTANSEDCIKGVDVFLLRTLSISGKAHKTVMDFSKYELLRVLDLKEWDHHELAEKELKKKRTDICKLFLLKYLGLPSSIREIPKVIQDLKHLETLDVEGTEIVEVYKEVIMVPNLKHLLGKFRLYAKYSTGNWVPEDCSLETFSGFVNNGKAAFPTLMQHMEKLKKVKMWCECDSEAKKKEVMEVLPIAIQKFIEEKEAQQKRSLSIVVKDCSTVSFMESLNFPGKLTKLKLHGGLDMVPEFIKPKIEQVGTPPRKECTTPLKVTSLCLSLTTLCGERRLFPFLLDDVDVTLLPSLKYLKLVEDKLGPLHIRKGHFPRLVRLCLVGRISIESITIEAGALEDLVSLHVICEHLNGLAGIQIGGLKELKELALDSKVKPTIIGEWRIAARGHPNKPQVLLIEADPKP